MGRLLMGVFQVVDRYRAMGRCLQNSIVLQLPLVLFISIATELILIPVWLYQVIRFMGRRSLAAVRARARFSRSTPMGWVLLTCIVLRQTPPGSTATDPSRLPE